MQAGKAAKKGILKAVTDAVVSVCPLADGGEGTTDALTDGMDGEKVLLVKKQIAIMDGLTGAKRQLWRWLRQQELHLCMKKIR